MLQNALAAEHVILSSAGAHAGQYWHQIVARKQADIARANHALWVVNSNATRPEIVQPFCRDHGARFVIFVRRPGAKTNSGPPTNERAQKYSSDRQAWSAIPSWPRDPKGLSEVTGRINSATAGLWFNGLEEVDGEEIDIRSYSRPTGEPLEGFQKHESAYPVRRMSPVSRRGYQVLAVGHLASPFAVWLKK
jgi:hypothetical protein